MAPPRLRTVASALRRRYGKPAPPVSDDPFELILWEQVAYLVPDAQRRAAFDALRDRVGLEPQKIHAAPLRTMLAIAQLGGSIAALLRARRMQSSAGMVLDRWNGRLRDALALPLPEARRALSAFAMIGEPGADKILATCGAATVLPLDSNALRVVQRLGFTADQANYRASYRQAREDLAPLLPRNREWLIETSQLLRQHGQELCRRNGPLCPECPVRKTCPSAR